VTVNEIDTVGAFVEVGGLVEGLDGGGGAWQRGAGEVKGEIIGGTGLEAPGAGYDCLIGFNGGARDVVRGVEGDVAVSKGAEGGRVAWTCP
jgi:hypothetical protein